MSGRRGGAGRLAAGAALWAGALLYLLPVLLLVMGSLKPDARVLAEAGSLRGLLPVGIGFDNYADVFRRVDFLRLLVNSLVVTGLITAIGLCVNALGGYALARLDWPGRRLALGAVLALLVVPLEAIAVPLFYEFTRLGLRDTYTAQVLPFVADAFAIYLFYTFFLGLPRELEEAARVDGAGTWRTFWSIIAPSARPAFAAAGLVTWLFRWGNFLWPLLVTVGPRVRPLPVGVTAFHTLPPLMWGDILAFGVMMVLPVAVFFLFGQRHLVAGLAPGGLKD